MSILVRLNSDWMSHIYAIDCRRVMVIIVNQETANCLSGELYRLLSPTCQRTFGLCIHVRTVQVLTAFSPARDEALFWYIAASALERRFFIVSGTRYSASPMEAFIFSFACPDLPSTV